MRLSASLRELTPKVLATIIRRYRDFSGCEDAVQEALLAATQQWPAQGVPENPQGWLTAVASRRVTDEMRAAASRRLREKLVVSLIPADEQIALAADEAANERDDTLYLFFMCCHPALAASSQIALTLRAVGGLTTAEIARAFLVPETTMAQRLIRAKQTISAQSPAFVTPTAGERRARLPSVLHVLYLIFSEGYTASSGDTISRVDLSDEAIRVSRLLEASVDHEPEVKGLIALMQLTDARRHARTGPQGELIPLDEQDRSLWNADAIKQGVSLLEATLGSGPLGPYQVQAAIAALHSQASSTDHTDWPQILALYDELLQFNDNPMVHLSRAIAYAMVHGPAAGIVALDALTTGRQLQGNHRLDAVRAHLMERAGNYEEAIRLYRAAANKATNTPERTYLLMKAAKLAEV